MGNSLRCCLACVLPCGALDLIRIVHLNGHVEEITRSVTAGDILRAYPNHVLSKPCSQGVELPRILILSPDSELKKGSIYFLVPDPSMNGDKKCQAAGTHKLRSSSKKSGSKIGKDDADDTLFSGEAAVAVPEKKSKSSRRNRRSRGQVSSWLPHLESIRED